MGTLPARFDSGWPFALFQAITLAMNHRPGPRPFRVGASHACGRFLSKRCRTAALVLLAGGLRLAAADVTVFAAASLTDALREIGARYQQTHHDHIYFNFAASSLLARQIREGAPADIFFSADEAWMDALEKRGLIVTATRTNRLSNSLVIVTSTDSRLAIRSAADLAGPAVKRVALADPRIVPAGVYSRIYLEQLHLWSAVQPKVVPTENVRGALAAVESGNVDAGMVYRTDAAISKRVRVACAIPARDGPEIRYPMALVKDSKQVEAARAFLHYLDSAEAAKVFEKFGFVVLP
jgi:molybdate transport system substrate-binding protein